MIWNKLAEAVQELMAEESEEIQEVVEELFGSEEKLAQEAKELEEALDVAFDNLMNKNDGFEELELDSEENIDSNFKELNDKIESAKELAQDLDIDLTFLRL